MKPIATTLDQPFGLSASTAKKQADLNAKIISHDQAVAEVQAKIDTLKAGEWTATHESTAGKLRARQVELLVEEIVIREQTEALLATISEQDLPAAREAAFQAFESTKADVLKALLSIGYVDGPIPGAENTRSITPDVVFRHPSVHSTRVQYQAIPHGIQDTRNQNLDRLADCRRQLEAHKAKSVAGLAA